MVNVELKSISRPLSVPKIKLKGYPRVGEFMELPDEKLGKIIKELEGDRLFQILKSYKIITYCGIKKLSYGEIKRIKGSDTDEKDVMDIFDFIPAQESFDVESFISGYPNVVELIKRIGREEFIKFLHLENEQDIPILLKRHNLSEEEHNQLFECINDFQLKDGMLAQISQTTFPSGLTRSNVHLGMKKNKCIGAIKNVRGSLIPELEAIYERKKYKIHQERFVHLEKDFAKEESSKIKSLLETIEFINMRKTTLCYLVEIICAEQKDYLGSSGTKPLRPLTQKEVAEIIGVCPSTLNRIIDERTIYTPWGEVKPIRDFFFTKDNLRKEWIKNILKGMIRRESRLQPYSDEAIKQKLKRLFNLNISREAIKQYRKELRIPASWQRRSLKNKIAT